MKRGYPPSIVCRQVVFYRIFSQDILLRTFTRPSRASVRHVFDTHLNFDYENFLRGLWHYGFNRVFWGIISFSSHFSLSRAPSGNRSRAVGDPGTSNLHKPCDTPSSSRVANFRAFIQIVLQLSPKSSALSQHDPPRTRRALLRYREPFPEISRKWGTHVKNSKEEQNHEGEIVAIRTYMCRNGVINIRREMCKKIGINFTGLQITESYLGQITCNPSSDPCDPTGSSANFFANFDQTIRSKSLLKRR